MNKYLFPCVLMFLNLCASVGYIFNKDYWMAVYWVLAFGLTFIVTFKGVL
jgi:positive regulator of sigma E activity